MGCATRSTHWLAGAAELAGLPNASALSICNDAGPFEAWEAVAAACGVDQHELVAKVAAVYRLPVANLDEAEPAAIRLVPATVAERHGVFPIRENYKTLIIAASNPNDLEAEQDVAFASGRRPIMQLAPPRALSEAIDAAYSPDRAVEQMLKHVAPASDELVRVVEDFESETPEEADLGSGPVVDLTNLILSDAVEQQASDVHMQPGTDGGVVRFRVDGVLRHYMRLPLPALGRVVSRIKVMGKLDIADHLRPQDGRAKIGVGGLSIDLRISTVPTRKGEKAVIRLLRPQTTGGLDDLGMHDLELDRFNELLTNRDGIVLVTGPTGSGKTTTLYAALKHLSSESINVMTVEDPVEYEMPGVTQIQVEAKQGVTFASALRAILRQDPDVIFVGEIRDPETAEIAVHASMTGHLVLATLHTNDAVGAVRRLEDLGLDKSTIATTLRGVLAQRLVRSVCTSCAGPMLGELTAEESRLQQRFAIPNPIRAHGCERCGHSGYSGRAPIVEAFTIDQELASMIASGADASRLLEVATAGGMRGLDELGKERALSGQTTVAELERVLGRADKAVRNAGPSATEERETAIALGTDPRAFQQSHTHPDPTTHVDDVENEEPVALVVDDDGATRTVVRALLEKQGFVVEEAKDGSDAMGRLDEGIHLSLMVLDLDMPNVGGREVLRRTRSWLATAGLPVIVLTGTNNQDAELELMEQGADDYLRKPVDPARLMVRIKAMMRRAGI